MSNIDYIKNVQVIGFLNVNGNDNRFIYNATNFPSNNPPSECVVRQVNYLNDEIPMNTVPFIYTVWTDMVNDNIVSFVTTGGRASVCPNTRIKLTTPLAGQIMFQVNYLDMASVYPEVDESQIVLNLDFIRYKQ